VTVFLITLFSLIPRIGLIGSGVAMIASTLVAFAGQSLAVSVWFRSRKAERLGSSVRDGPQGEGSTPGS
jgi:hypothetical protein